MGILRILLAICVFCTHSQRLGNLPWLDGGLAVELFFVISGFYMQLVLSTKYTRETLGNKWISQFYKARYFRLLPMYLLGCTVVLFTSLLRPSSKLTHMLGDIWALPVTFGNLCAKTFLYATNATMLFQDVAMFLALDNGRVHWAADLGSAKQPLWQGLIVPQAWSLGVELSFYLLAPYLLRMSSRRLTTILLCSIASKVIVVSSFNLADPWTYRFFPFELGYFLLGSMAYRCRSMVEQILPQRLGIYVVYSIAFAISMFYVPVPLATVVYPAALASLLPIMFRITSTVRLDRLIGELSYPFYIFHLFAISLADSIGRKWQIGSTTHLAWLAFGIAVVMSLIGLTLELRVIDPWRSGFATRKRSSPGEQVTVRSEPALPQVN